MEALIQLELPLRWYEHSKLWDNDDGDPPYYDLVGRSTERKALQRLYLHARLIEKHGHTRLRLSWAHRLVMRMELTCMTDYPHVSAILEKDGSTSENVIGVCQWISDRSTFSQRQVLALLEEANEISATRELLGLPVIDLDNEPFALPRAA